MSWNKQTQTLDLFIRFMRRDIVKRRILPLLKAGLKPDLSVHAVVKGRAPTYVSCPVLSPSLSPLFRSLTPKHMMLPVSSEAGAHFQPSIIHGVLITDELPSTFWISFAERIPSEIITFSSAAVWRVANSDVDKAEDRRVSPEGQSGDGENIVFFN